MGVLHYMVWCSYKYTLELLVNKAAITELIFQARG